MSTMSDWGKECKVQMLRKNMSLKDVAAVTGYTRTYISAIINGRVTPPFSTLEKINLVLGVDRKLLEASPHR